jgi:hypothetical protein
MKTMFTLLALVAGLMTALPAHASGFKNAGVHVQQYLYDYAVDGGVYTSAFTLSSKAGYAPLPIGAIVKKVTAKVITAVSGSSSTVKWGNATTADAYAPAIAEATLVADYVTDEAKAKGTALWDDTNDNNLPYLIDTANKAKFVMTVGTASLTAGKILFLVEYYLPSL